MHKSELVQVKKTQLFIQCHCLSTDLKVTTALSETCLLLMQRWQTKCVEKMDSFVGDQAQVLAETSLVFENLNERSRCSILATASTALKFSAFMLEKEEEILIEWCVQGPIL